MGNSPDKYLSTIKYVDMQGKVAIVTGANTGIGYITSRELAKMGAHVILACRSRERGEAALERLKKEAQEQAVTSLAIGEIKAELMLLDLGSLASIRDFVAAFKAKNLGLHVLVNNAGIMALPERLTTVDGFEAQFGTNHVGHFYLTVELLDIIKNSEPARIVNLSSMAHSMGKMNWDDLHYVKGYSAWDSYGQSKLANVLFTKELQRRFDEEGKNVSCYAVHPGIVQTELMRNMSSPMQFLGNTFGSIVCKTVEDGSLTSIKCATDPDVGHLKGFYWADSAQLEPSGAARNSESAVRLWKVTDELIQEKLAQL